MPDTQSSDAAASPAAGPQGTYTPAGGVAQSTPAAPTLSKQPLTGSVPARVLSLRPDAPDLSALTRPLNLRDRSLLGMEKVFTVVDWQIFSASGPASKAMHHGGFSSDGLTRRTFIGHINGTA